MFNVDTKVKNNRMSLFRHLISRLVETSYTGDFNFAVLDSQNLFFVSKVTV